jgi:hypothetical protein
MPTLSSQPLRFTGVGNQLHIWGTRTISDHASIASSHCEFPRSTLHKALLHLNGDEATVMRGLIEA